MSKNRNKKTIKNTNKKKNKQILLQVFNLFKKTF